MNYPAKQDSPPHVTSDGLSFRSGDRINVLKYVSGQQYFGLNQRTLKRGYFHVSALVTRVEPSRRESLALNVEPGKTYFACKEPPAKPSSITLKYVLGDSVKIIKHVSGSTYAGMNTRTLKKGHVHASVLSTQNPEADMNPENHVAAPSPTTAPAVSDGWGVSSKTSEACHGENSMTEMSPAQAVTNESEVSHNASPLEYIEEDNAAQWDEVPMKRKNASQITTVAPVPIATPVNQIAMNSKFAVLGDEIESEGERVKKLVAEALSAKVHANSFSRRS
jgi:hypothetical protein